MVFNPSDPVINESLFACKDQTASEFGLVQKEELPKNVPETHGLGFALWTFVDADHAGDLVTGQSRTGFLVHLNLAPVHWLSKKQTGVETSSLGSEFVAMKQCTECICEFQCKLQMMGIPCEGHA